MFYSNILSNKDDPASAKNPKKKYCMKGKHANIQRKIPKYCIG
jgi:hypothetical protein